MYNVDADLEKLSAQSCRWLVDLESAIAEVRDSQQRTFGNSWIGPMSDFIHGLHLNAMSSTSHVREDLFELKMWFTTPPLHSHVSRHTWPQY